MSSIAAYILVFIVALFSVGSISGTEVDYAEVYSGVDTMAGEASSTEAAYPVATITMEDGSVMKLELYPDVAPITVENFTELANNGFYDGLTFHRVISGFMVQGGDPLGNGTGGPGHTIKGEFAANGVENNISHVRGVISMARASDPDSAGSQFFIMHADANYLDGQYAAFGKIIEGIEVVDAIAAVETDVYDKPVVDVVIESIRVE